MPYIKAWAEKHHVEVDITKEALTDDNVEGVAGYD
jgi:D-lactate dehydrogenase